MENEVEDLPTLLQGIMQKKSAVVSQEIIFGMLCGSRAFNLNIQGSDKVAYLRKFF
jgi:hypothetical protein